MEKYSRATESRDARHEIDTALEDYIQNVQRETENYETSADAEELTIQSFLSDFDSLSGAMACITTSRHARSPFLSKDIAEVRAYLEHASSLINKTIYKLWTVLGKNTTQTPEKLAQLTLEAWNEAKEALKQELFPDHYTEVATLLLRGLERLEMRWLANQRTYEQYKEDPSLYVAHVFLNTKTDHPITMRPGVLAIELVADDMDAYHIYNESNFTPPGFSVEDINFGGFCTNVPHTRYPRTIVVRKRSEQSQSLWDHERAHAFHNELYILTKHQDLWDPNKTYPAQVDPNRSQQNPDNFSFGGAYQEMAAEDQLSYISDYLYAVNHKITPRLKDELIAQGIGNWDNRPTQSARSLLRHLNEPDALYNYRNHQDILKFFHSPDFAKLTKPEIIEKGQALAQKILVDDYTALVQAGANAVHTMKEKGYPDAVLIARLMMHPLSRWQHLAQELSEFQA